MWQRNREEPGKSSSAQKPRTSGSIGLPRQSLMAARSNRRSQLSDWRKVTAARHRISNRWHICSACSDVAGWSDNAETCRCLQARSSLVRSEWCLEFRRRSAGQRVRSRMATRIYERVFLALKLSIFRRTRPCHSAGRLSATSAVKGLGLVDLRELSRRFRCIRCGMKQAKIVVRRRSEGLTGTDFDRKSQLSHVRFEKPLRTCSACPEES